MFLLRARNQLNEKKHQQRVLKYTCLYVASVELFMEIGPDQSAMKKTIERTVGNLDLKTVSGDSVNLIISNNGIVIQDSRTETLIMAHALKRICFTTSFPKKKIYVFVSRLPQEERIFAHFFLMHDKNSGQKITQELAHAFTHAYKEKKTRSIQRDRRRSLRTQPQLEPQQLQHLQHLQQPQQPQQHVVAASPKKQKAKYRPFSEFTPPPPYVDHQIRDQTVPEAYDVDNPAHLPTAPPLSPEAAPYNPPAAQSNPFSSQQPGLSNGNQRPPIYQAQLRPASPLHDQRAQNPFSPFHAAAQPPSPSLDELPSYNSALDQGFKQERVISKDNMLIDLSSPEHIQTPTNLFRSLSTSNMLDELRGPTPPPPFQPHAVELPFEPQARESDASRSRLGAQGGFAGRPKSGLYPVLSYGLEQRAMEEPMYDMRLPQTPQQEYQEDKYALVNEPWYQPGLPRDIIVEILMSQKEGSFFIRESSSQPGKLVLSVRSSFDVTHYLIVKSKQGYHLENDKLFFPSLHFLVMHHSINKGLLPCTLALADSNPTYLRADHLESSDSEAEGEDPIYTKYAVTDSMKLHH